MHRGLSARVLIFLLVVQGLDLVLAPLIQIRMIQPLLLPLTVVFGAFFWQDSRIFTIALVTGLLRDLTVSPVFGAGLFSTGAMTLVLAWAVQKMDKNSLFVRELVSFFYILGIQSLCGLSASSQGSGPSTWSVASAVLGSAAYTAAIAPLFFAVAAWIFHETRPTMVLRQYELFR